MNSLVRAALALALASTAVADIALLQIRIVEGDGEVHAAGSRSARPFTVEITDESGQPVPRAAVSFSLPQDGPGALFANGLHSEVVLTDSHGRAGVRNMRFNNTPGRFEIRITVSSQQVRAGTVSSQYIAETRPGAMARQRSVRPRRKWTTILLVAAAAAGGGVAAGLAGGKSTSTASTPPAPGVTVGPPTITVGKP